MSKLSKDRAREILNEMSTFKQNTFGAFVFPVYDEIIQVETNYAVTFRYLLQIAYDLNEAPNSPPHH